MHAIHSGAFATVKAVAAPRCEWNATIYVIHRHPLALKSGSEVGSKVTAFQSHLPALVCAFLWHMTSFVQTIFHIPNSTYVYLFLRNSNLRIDLFRNSFSNICEYFSPAEYRPAYDNLIISPSIRFLFSILGK